jgi:glutamate transport system substrate-binding protein
LSQETEPNATTATPSGTSRSRQLRLVALTVVLTVLAVALVPVVLGFGPPTRDKLMEQAGLKGKRELLIGVKNDQPGIALQLPGGGWQGFDIDIAYLIASYLDFDRSQVVLLPIESEDRARRQAPYRDRFVTVDLVIASYSITEEREKEGATFSAPYLHTEQSVITLADEPGPVSSLEDLRGRKVCTLTTSTSQARLRDVGAEAVGRNNISQCVQELHDGRIDAVTTDAAILAGFVTASQDPDAFPTALKRVKPLRHWDIGSSPQERWGVNTGPNKALRDLVDLALHASAKDEENKVWEEAYDDNLRWQQPFNRPQSVAEEQQPDPRKVEVRQWPWERFALPLPGHPGTPSAPSRASGRGVRRGPGRRSSGC